jgi:hypothetical protein
MSTSLLTIPVDTEAAKAFEAAAPEIRKSIEIMLDLRLRELVSRRPISLVEVMDKLGLEAQSNGLTIEMIGPILHQ